ncbi:unnamed protein product, partial [Meganyctiphanes norvegica]
FDSRWRSVKEPQKIINTPSSRQLRPQLKLDKVGYGYQPLREETELEFGRSCEFPFMMLGKECFYLHTDDRITWLEAVELCEEMCSFLAEVNDPKPLLAYVNQTYFRQECGFWLGATDQKIEGKWTWNSGFPIDRSVWGMGQPNNYKDQDCMEIKLHHHEKVANPDGYCFIQDVSCDEKQYAICEKL